jgi:predicted house-cleaning NTP pyrophosphatase (Maf/HAM1 superfamily)
MSLILASASQIRGALLDGAQVAHKRIPAHID